MEHEIYVLAKDLGLAPAAAIVLCYLHGLVTGRPVAVRSVACLEALVAHAGVAPATAAAEALVPRGASPATLLEILRRIGGKTVLAIALVGLGVGCGARAVDVPRLHDTLVKVQTALELELAATAPISTAHAAHREELRADVAAAVSASR